MRALTTIVVCVAVLCGCTAGRRSHMAEIHGSTWDRPATVTIENSDTTGLYDIRIALRHNGLRAGETIEMTVRTQTPDSMWVEEPMRLRIADDGRSRPSQHETSAVYRRRVRLAREGLYRITVTPVRAVRGVTAVGADLTESSADEG